MGASRSHGPTIEDEEPILGQRLLDLRVGWLDATINSCCEVQRKGTLSQKIKPTEQVCELPGQASCHPAWRERCEMAQAPGKSVPLEELRPGKHMVWGKRRMKEHRES